MEENQSFYSDDQRNSDQEKGQEESIRESESLIKLY